MKLAPTLLALAIACCIGNSSVEALRGSSSDKKKTRTLSEVDGECSEYSLDHAMLPEISGNEQNEVLINVAHRRTNSFWGTLFLDSRYIQNVNFQGWCANRNFALNNGDKLVDVWSSYSHDIFQDDAIIDEDHLFRVNWLINNWSTGPASVTFPAVGDLSECTGVIGWREFQMAVWKILDVTDYISPSISGVNQCVGLHLAYQAEQIDDYQPDCHDEHERIALVLIFDNDAEEIEKQTVVVDYPLSATAICSCDDSSAPSSAPTPGVLGDPHFKTWTGMRYDFHGVCDLVLLQDREFSNGLGLDVHIRTERTKQWSYISAAVVRLGDETLEVRGGSGSNYWLNLEAGADLTSGLSGFPVEHVKNNEKQNTYTIRLEHGASLVLKTFKDMVRVDVNHGHGRDFASSAGLMGSFQEGQWMARDNESEISDPVMFGLEWQVLADEPMLFMNVEGPQAPEQCEMPSLKAASRRLSEASISLEDAELACSRVDPSDFDLCVFDVMATSDMEVAGAY